MTTGGPARRGPARRAPARRGAGPAGRGPAARPRGRAPGRPPPDHRTPPAGAATRAADRRGRRRPPAGPRWPPAPAWTTSGRQTATSKSQLFHYFPRGQRTSSSPRSPPSQAGRVLAAQRSLPGPPWTTWAAWDGWRGRRAGSLLCPAATGAARSARWPPRWPGGDPALAAQLAAHLDEWRGYLGGRPDPGCAPPGGCGPRPIRAPPGPGRVRRAAGRSAADPDHAVSRAPSPPALDGALAAPPRRQAAAETPLLRFPIHKRHPPREGASRWLVTRRPAARRRSAT